MGNRGCWCGHRKRIVPKLLNKDELSPPTDILCALILTRFQPGGCVFSISPSQPFQRFSCREDGKPLKRFCERDVAFLATRLKPGVNESKRRPRDFAYTFCLHRWAELSLRIRSSQAVGFSVGQESISPPAPASHSAPASSSFHRRQSLLSYFRPSHKPRLAFHKWQVRYPRVG